MSPEFQFGKEKHESLTVEQIAYLAGVLEVSGEVGFHFNYYNKTRTNASPHIVITSKEQSFLEHLTNTYGGFVASDGKNHQRWRLGKGLEVANLMISLKPFVVSRMEILVSIENWLETDEGWERLEIAEDMEDFNRFKDGSVEDYTNLITNPSFLAGVIDARACVSTTKDKALMLSISSKNEALLKALKINYEGSIDRVAKVGDKFRVLDKDSVVRNDVFQWKVSNFNARKVISLAKPFLAISPFEGWDKIKIEENRGKVENRNNEVISYVTQEINDLIEGRITRLLTWQELQDRFSISSTTLARILRKLPDDTRKQRFVLTYKSR